MVDSALEARLLQLQQARALVDSDPSYFPQIVVGVLPVFHDASTELRRWVADFVQLAFTSVKLGSQEKQELAITCLDQLVSALSTEKDISTSKSFIQISSLMYPLLFRHVAANPQSIDIWRKTSALKNLILERMSSDNRGVRICSMKFAQKVIATQSISAKDPRLVSRDDVSLNLVMANHPVLQESELSAEAESLLGRCLAVLFSPTPDVDLIIATLNCLCILVKNRAVFHSTILSAIFAFEVHQLGIDHDTTIGKLQIRFVDKAIRVILTHLLKTNSAGSFGPKIQHYLVNRAKRTEDDPSKKRQASEPAESVGKRIRTEIDGSGTPQPSVLSIPPLPEGPVSVATIFNLANDNSLANFDVNQLPQHLAVQILLASLSAIDKEQLDSSLEAIRARHTAVQSRSVAQPIKVDGTVRSELGASVIKMENGQEANTAMPDISMAPAPGPFHMPEPAKLDRTMRSKYVENYLTTLLQNPGLGRKSNSSSLLNKEFGLEKTVGTVWDKDAWTATITRLITRGIEHESEASVEAGADEQNFANLFRARILAFVTQSFRERMDFCTIWLNEEWYSASLNEQIGNKTSAYHIWSNKVLDAILPYLEAKDRLFMRFLSDLPELDMTMIKKLRTLCVDPDRASLGYTTLQYLIMLRPPVREMCLDLVEKLHEEDKSETVQQEKILSRWRPSAIIKVEENGHEVAALGATSVGA